MLRQNGLIQQRRIRLSDSTENIGEKFGRMSLKKVVRKRIKVEIFECGI
jgi:hypothetical protein